VKFRSLGLTEIQSFSNEEIVVPLLLIVHSILGFSKGLSEQVAENEEDFASEIVEEILREACSRKDRRHVTVNCNPDVIGNWSLETCQQRMLLGYL
jgi:ABC-type sulfate transport system, permease component